METWPEFDVRKQIKTNLLELNNVARKKNLKVDYELLLDSGSGTESVMHDYSRRIQDIIDSTGSTHQQQKIKLGIAKADDPTYNDILLQMFGRIKDIESDVNVDRPNVDLTRLQMLITSVCTTGADFVGVSDVYFVGTPLTRTEFEQNKYRAIRMCSHALSDMQKGVEIHTVDFDVQDEFPSVDEFIEDTNFLFFMNRCIDSEIRGGSIQSRYSLAMDVPATFGKSLKAYDKGDLQSDAILKLQSRRVLQIQGDTDRYAPQFVIDDEQDLRNFFKYTLIPSSSVIEFVKKYEACKTQIDRMTCIMQFYYRDSEMMDTEPNLVNQSYEIVDKQNLNIVQLKLKLLRFNLHLDEQENTLDPTSHTDNFYIILNMLLEIEAMLKKIQNVNLQDDEWDEAHYLEVHRLINRIGFRVSKLVRGRYAYFIKEGDDVKKIATYGYVKVD
ncbi:hypothetical protein CYMTET_41259 [Cymbomonas tetramitiformis]|uniref:Uncharacterized protein n=1 Tax=Cymbomonas tetramitiformis TaxID=36881 RepID=A0AAE0C7I9_9CHLO|nr:hypothetical protein CYMTET_41259 [Cymbomonas tetramitiformis]